MPHIVFIAPDSTICNTAERMALELGLQNRVQLHVAGLDRCLEVARQAEEDGADVVVARGWSADRILSSDVRTPVVHIPVGIQDLAEMLGLARRVTGLEHPRIAFVTFPRVHWDLSAFARLLGMTLRVYPSHSEKDSIAAAVKKAVADGADLVMGGGTSARMAQQLDTPAAILVSGEDSIRQALLQADKVVYARKLEQTHVQQMRAVLESSRDGILALDSQGRIVLTNPAARRMLRIKGEPVGQKLDAFLSVPNMQNCLIGGEAINDEVVTIQGRELLVSAVPVHLQREMTGVVISVQETCSITELENKIRRTTHGLAAFYTFADIKGKSPQIIAAVSQARRYAAGRQSVLIMGDTGTGKELFAQAIHNESPFRHGPFVAVNCGALAPSLLESELFGYDAGAFTGASRKGKPGLFELAHEGTLFLDEISELDMHGQTRLLRAIEDRSVMRLGGNRRLPVDLRIIAATNINLVEKVRQGLFRQDLYYRLKVLTLSLPPLRQREGDVKYLAQYFLSVAGAADLQLEPDALDALTAHAWPGNVRELRYFLDSLSFDCQGGKADAFAVRSALSAALCEEVQNRCSPEPPPCAFPAHSAAYGHPLPHAMDGSPAASRAENPHTESSSRPAHFTMLEASPEQIESQKSALLEALRQCNGHQGQAAHLLGLDTMKVPLDATAKCMASVLPYPLCATHLAFSYLRPTHVLSQLDQTNIIGTTAALLIGAQKALMSFRSVNPSHFPYINAEWLNPQYMELITSTRVVLTGNSKVGSDDYAQWLGIDSTRITTIHNAVIVPEEQPLQYKQAIRQALGIEPCKKVILGVFRWTKEKNFHLFFEIVRDLHARYPDLLVLHAGQGPYEHEVRRTLERHNLKDVVRLLGRRKDVMDLMHCADVLLLTSNNEGLPNVILEAQAASLPVVATRVGGIPEAVQDGKTALLARRGDKEALVAHCAALLDDDALRQSMGRAGRKFIQENFSHAALGDRILDLIGLPRVAERPTTQQIAPLHNKLGISEALAWNCIQKYFSEHSMPVVYFTRHLAMKPLNPLHEGSLWICPEKAHAGDRDVILFDWCCESDWASLAKRIPIGRTAVFLDNACFEAKIRKGLNHCGFERILVHDQGNLYLIPTVHPPLIRRLWMLARSFFRWKV